VKRSGEEGGTGNDERYGLEGWPGGDGTAKGKYGGLSTTVHDETVNLRSR
jgi:hypothetical protein